MRPPLMTTSTFACLQCYTTWLPSNSTTALVSGCSYSCLPRVALARSHSEEQQRSSSGGVVHCTPSTVGVCACRGLSDTCLTSMLQQLLTATSHRAHQGVPSRPRSVRGKLDGSKKTANPKSAIKPCWTYDSPLCYAAMGRRYLREIMCNAFQARCTTAQSWLTNGFQRCPV